MRLLLTLIAATALAQQPVQVSLSTPAPPAAQATAVVIGNPGNQNYTYFVITSYPGGAVVSNAALVQFAPATLTSGNYIQIGWNPQPGATSYDVVRSAGFSGSCTACAVATGLTVNSAQDTGAALSNYTAGASAAQGSGTLYINTREFAPPQLRRVVNGVDAAVGTGNGTLTGVTATSPIVSSGGTAPVISCPTCGSGSGTVTSVSGTAPVEVATGTTTPVVSVNGLGTLTGAVKANGSGAVTQAACADLSNAGTGCSGAAIPPETLINGACVTGLTASPYVQTPSANCTVDASGNVTETSAAIGVSPPALTPGTGGAFAVGEGTSPSVGPAGSVDACYGSSTHSILCNMNNSGYLALVQGPSSTTSGHCATWNSTNGSLLSDAACSGGGGTSGWSGLTASLAVNATQYTAPVGGALTSATETVVSLKAPATATISNLQVTLSASLGTGTTMAVTLEDGTATPTTLTCTTASAGTSCSDTTHSVTVTAGDLLSFKIVAAGTVTAATPQLEIGYAVGTSGVGVTAVTGTSPIVATATTTPAISCPTCATGPGSATSGNLVTWNGAGGLALSNGPHTPLLTWTAGIICSPQFAFCGQSAEWTPGAPITITQFTFYTGSAPAGCSNAGSFVIQQNGFSSVLSTINLANGTQVYTNAGLSINVNPASGFIQLSSGSTAASGCSTYAQNGALLVEYKMQ